MVRPTVVRTRGEVSIRPAVGAAADVGIVGAYGLAVVSTDAFAAGVASIPQPFQDADWGGWFVWRSFSINFEFVSAIGQGLSQHNQEVDSKAMRKVDTNETIVLIAESQAGAFDISMPLRLLFKLS